MEQAEYIEALAAVPDRLAGSELGRRLRGDTLPPAFLIDTEGICAYAGFTGDTASRRAQAWLETRFQEAEARYPA
jgi:hypothetical protein